MNFPQNLIELRTKKNLTQEQVADQLGISRQAVSKWEAGQSMPDVEKLIQLAGLFEISTDELIHGLVEKPAIKVHHSNLHTILVFIFVLTMWLAGFVMILCMLCFSREFDSQGIYFGKGLMTSATVLFGAMLAVRGIARIIELKKIGKKE